MQSKRNENERCSSPVIFASHSGKISRIDGHPKVSKPFPIIKKFLNTYNGLVNREYFLTSSGSKKFVLFSRQWLCRMTGLYHYTAPLQIIWLVTVVWDLIAACNKSFSIAKSYKIVWQLFIFFNWNTILKTIEHTNNIKPCVGVARHGLITNNCFATTIRSTNCLVI